ncbi:MULTISPECIES: hypothetical protein [unclassified Actinopolyspora]|uniref:hypothetical protein n=1 Tax=unclassified Actinopolyspora TaxID=2639451 RepID=UPI0013F67C77|nr:MULTISPECIES: hypothetical protein [unclassified Actinopolyspora]NHD17738.1 hypothetical protein [Actinopolyspora sp. BKK2]NHE76529.1 hypothetical protein [Actinopolyspora sp. BKK1]
MEEVAEPGAAPEAEQAIPGAPCVPCLMLVMGATADGAASGTELGEAHNAPASSWGDVLDGSAVEPAGAVETTTVTGEAAEECPPKTVLAISMLKAQWLLDDAAHDISGGRYSTAQASELVEILEELSRLMRETIGDEHR